MRTRKIKKPAAEAKKAKESENEEVDVVASAELDKVDLTSTGRGKVEPYINIFELSKLST